MSSSTHKKRSPCEKLMQLMKTFIIKLSSFPMKGPDSPLSPPHNNHPMAKQPKTPAPKPPNSRQVDVPFKKIRGVDHREIGIGGDGSRNSDMQTSELKASVANLKAKDYIRRFHERNKHETVSLVLPPPPPPLPPHIPQGRFFMK